MNFRDLLKRSNLTSIENYLLYGDENLEKSLGKTYAERLEEARKKATAFFHSRYSDARDYEEIEQCFNEQAEVFLDVYFEIGLLLGAKIGYQIRGRMEELQ